MRRKQQALLALADNEDWLAGKSKEKEKAESATTLAPRLVGLTTHAGGSGCKAVHPGGSTGFSQKDCRGSRAVLFMRKRVKSLACKRSAAILDKHRYENQVAPHRDFGVVTNPVFLRVTSTCLPRQPTPARDFRYLLLSVSDGDALSLKVILRQPVRKGGLQAQTNAGS